MALQRGGLGDVAFRQLVAAVLVLNGGKMLKIQGLITNRYKMVCILDGRR